jgi:hypothetical protein
VTPASRLAQLARPRPQPEAPPADEPERCDLCAERLPPDHRHLLDLDSRRILCACQACRILFDRRAAGGGHLRLVPERRVRLGEVDLELDVPVGMAFLFRSSATARVAAFYPGPMGATESALDVGAWAAVLERCGAEDDVEALLVNRTGGAREHFLVPVDDCYRLAGLIRRSWRGFGGGPEAWEEIDAFFDDLRRRAAAGEEATWRS